MSSSPSKKKPVVTPKRLVSAYKLHGSLKKAHKALAPNMWWGDFLKIYQKAVAEGLMPPVRVGSKTVEQLKNPEAIFNEPIGSAKVIDTKELSIPKRGVRRYLFTSAQNNTHPFMPFWNNLKHLADHYKAEIHVARMVYFTNGMSAMMDKTKGFDRMSNEKRDIWWHQEFEPYLSDNRLEVGPGLIWCGEMNIIPTAENPLSGLEVYTGRRSGIFPHTKVAMQSVASSKHDPVKFNFTTGTVTMRNYVQRKAGLKAQFHHIYAALLVEVDSDGDWFCRQIVSDSDGVIHDLDVKVDANGLLTTGNSVEAITWGDIHVDSLEEWVRDLAWGTGGMLDALKPKYQFLHDVLGFRAKSHHDLKKPHQNFRKYLLGETDVRKECVQACDFLADAISKNVETVVVDSNHHDHLGRWLEEQDGRMDPKNVEFWTAMQAHVWKALRKGAETPNYFRLMVQEVHPALVPKLTILDRDKGFVICHDRNGGVECGVHGHAGPNGGKGSPRAFARLGRKANLGHYHAAGILEGIYHAGTCGKLDPDWTTGPGAWSHSHIVTYPNGKRTIVTMWNNKWKA